MLNIQKSIKNYKYFLRESGPVQNNIEDTQRSQEVKEVKSEVGLSSYEQDHNSK